MKVSLPSFLHSKSSVSHKQSFSSSSSSQDHRFPHLLSGLRLLQLLLAFIPLTLLISYVTHLQNGPSKSNFVALGIVSASVAYSLGAGIITCCISSSSWIITTVLCVLDWVFAIGWIAVAILMKPTDKCGSLEKTRERRTRRRVERTKRRRSERAIYRRDEDDTDDEDDISSSATPGVPPATDISPGPTPTVPGGGGGETQTSGAPSTQITDSPNSNTLLPTENPTAQLPGTTASPSTFAPGVTLLPEISGIQTQFPTFTSPRVVPTAVPTGGVAIGIEAGISTGDCRLAMGVFILAIMSILAFSLSTLIPCVLRRRNNKPIVEDEDRLVEKQLPTFNPYQQERYSKSDEFMHGAIAGSTVMGSERGRLRTRGGEEGSVRGFGGVERDDFVRDREEVEREQVLRREEESRTAAEGKQISREMKVRDWLGGNAESK